MRLLKDKDDTQNVILIAEAERFADANGSSHQEELARCVPGEPIELRREPDNSFDPGAMALISARGIQVSFRARRDALWLNAAMEAEDVFKALVCRVEPRDRPISPLVVTVRLRRWKFVS